MILLNNLKIYNEEYKATEDAVAFEFISNDYLIEILDDTNDVFISQYRNKIKTVPFADILYKIPITNTENIQYYEDNTHIIYIVYFNASNNVYFVRCNKHQPTGIDYKVQSLQESISSYSPTTNHLMLDMDLDIDLDIELDMDEDSFIRKQLGQEFNIRRSDSEILRMLNVNNILDSEDEFELDPDLDLDLDLDLDPDLHPDLHPDLALEA